MDERGHLPPARVRFWRALPPLAVDAAIAVVLLAVSLIEVALSDEENEHAAVGALLLVAMSAVVVVRRRWPVPVWLASGVLVSLYGTGTFADPRLFYAPLLAIYTVVALTTWRTAVWTGVITMSAVVLVMVLDPHDDTLDWVVTLLCTTTAWLLGNNVRVHRAYAREMEARAERLQRERRAQAEQAVADERLRLARELHDVTAHHVSVIALHAEAAQAQLPDRPDQAGRSLEVIGEVARTTLEEMRRVVGAWREPGGAAPLAPRPGLDQLPTLLRDVELAGLPVELHVTGTPRPLGDAVDTSAYRLVQEALTNVIRHAGAAHAEVEVRYEPDALAVVVTDDGDGPPATTSGGHGLTGMSERVALFGGTFSAAAQPGGGFAVSARLPL